MQVGRERLWGKSTHARWHHYLCSTIFFFYFYTNYTAGLCSSMQFFTFLGDACFDGSNTAEKKLPGPSKDPGSDKNDLTVDCTLCGPPPANNMLVRQMFGHGKVYSDTLPPRLFAAVGSLFMYVPQRVSICAYLCGSALFEFSLSNAAC